MFDGYKLKQLRESREMSREELSQATFYVVNEYEIEQWENNIGEPSSENLKSLATAFNMTMDELYEELYEELFVSDSGGVGAIASAIAIAGLATVGIYKFIKNRFKK